MRILMRLSFWRVFRAASSSLRFSSLKCLILSNSLCSKSRRICKSSSSSCSLFRLILDMKDDILEADPTRSLQEGIFLVIPIAVAHSFLGFLCVCLLSEVEKDRV